MSCILDHGTCYCTGCEGCQRAEDDEFTITSDECDRWERGRHADAYLTVDYAERGRRETQAGAKP